MQFLRDTDWQEFRDQHPGAAAFLDGRGLFRELAYLTHLRGRVEGNGSTLTDWQAKRLDELEYWEHATDYPHPAPVTFGSASQDAALSTIRG